MSNDFKEVLEVRTEVRIFILRMPKLTLLPRFCVIYLQRSLQNLKQQKNRRDQFTQRSVTSNLPPSAMTGHSTGSVLLADEMASGASDYAINMDGVADGGMQHQGAGYQSQQLQLIDEQVRIF